MNSLRKTLRTSVKALIFMVVFAFFVAVALSFFVACTALDILLLAMLIGTLVVLVSGIVAAMVIDALEDPGGM